MSIYSIIMFIFSGCLFLYALLLALLKDVDLIPKSYMSKISDKKYYAKQFAKLMAILASVFLVSGIIGLFSQIKILMIIAVVFLIVGFIGTLIIGGKFIVPPED